MNNLVVALENARLKQRVVNEYFATATMQALDQDLDQMCGREGSDGSDNPQT